MAGVRTGERKLKFDTSARYKQIASYALTVNIPTKFLPEKGYSANCLQLGSGCLVTKVSITYIYDDSLYYKRFVV